VLFADLRGFTARSDHATPAETAALLRRFYGHAERVLFPEALIDKLIGDEVMALYLPAYLLPSAEHVNDDQRTEIAVLMVEHALGLLRSIGYGEPQGPEFEVGIGLDYGEVFVGNIGDEAVHDFTAIGDVVNTASRLQHEAAGGEVVLSARLAAHLHDPPGRLEQLELRGKDEPVSAYRLSV
jgi:adenylate cyclase